MKLPSRLWPRVALATSSLALAICIVVIPPVALAANAASTFLSFSIPIIAFAFAIAIYLGKIRRSWHMSLTWLLNAVVAMYLAMLTVFQGHSIAAERPVRFALMLTFLVPAFLNSLTLYPKPVKSAHGAGG